MNAVCTYCRLSFDDADPEAFVGLRCKAMFCNFRVIYSWVAFTALPFLNGALVHNIL